jgi:hypothetical protein
MRKPDGYGIIVDPDGPTWERDAINCGHCNANVWVKPGSASTVYLILHRDGRWTEEAGAFCRVCMTPVCLRCHGLGVCTPLEKWLDQQEHPDRPIRVTA